MENWARSPSPRRASPASWFALSRATGSAAPLAIVKLGGSHASGSHIKDWLTAIAAEAGSIAIVPGGGPFADAVRTTQTAMGYDDRAAHVMALMAMAQFGRALQSLNPALSLAASRSAILLALEERRVPVWSPEQMARAAALPETWDLTSDSLSAWLAGALGASSLILVKHGDFERATVDAHDLAARGVVDPLFPRLSQRERRSRLARRPSRQRETRRRVAAPDIS